MFELNSASTPHYFIRILLLVLVQNFAFRVSGLKFRALGVGVRVAASVLGFTDGLVEGSGFSV